MFKSQSLFNKLHFFQTFVKHLLPRSYCTVKFLMLSHSPLANTVCFVARKHTHADGKSSPFKIKVESPAERSRQPVTPSLVSRPWSGSPSVIRPQACAPWEKTATAEWQPTTGFTAVVSGGRQVGRMDDLSEGILHCPLVLWHVLLLLPLPFCSFTPLYVPAYQAAQQQTGNGAVKHYVNPVQNAEGIDFLLICCCRW